MTGNFRFPRQSVSYDWCSGGCIEGCLRDSPSVGGYAVPSAMGDALLEGPGGKAVPRTSEGRTPNSARNRLLKWEELLKPIE